MQEKTKTPRKYNSAESLVSYLKGTNLLLFR